MPIKKLLMKDFLDCTDIVMEKRKIAGTRSLPFDKLQKGLEKYFLDNNFHAFGVFQGDTLISFITVFFVEESSKGKYWAITNFYSKGTTDYFDFNKEQFGDLVRYTIDFAEQQGYMQFYYCVSKKINNVYERKWKQNSRSRNENYHVVTVEDVPPNTVPKDMLYWKLMGETLRDDIMIIKHRYRKNEQ